MMLFVLDISGLSSHFVRRLIFCAAALLLPVTASATLTVSPITWNTLGLDSNSPASGPHNFPVGARVCSDVATTNVAVNFVFDSANPNINLRAGSLSTINFASIGAGNCADAYFEVDVTQTAAAYNTARRYHITATDFSGTSSTPVPRELFVEHLISQSRNSITDVKFGPNLGSLTSVPAGGSMNLIVGNTYVIQLLGGTATQGYEQFEAFINFPNTVFQILSVNTSYSADNSPYVPNPNDKLYADACLWQNDPNSPIYRACGGGDFKAGGSNVVTTYTIKIISGGGTAQALNTLLYDFSGSSFHYNADYSTGARIANIIDPSSATISKKFTPNPTSLNGVSALTITLTNPNGGTLAGYNFVDNLPANLVVATPSSATTSGCGTPTLTANAGSSSISFSNGTLAANSTCVINVNVTPTATGSLVNTTNDLFIDTLDTGHNATATLTVNSAPPPGTGLCGVTLANWSVPNGTTANPPDLIGGVPTLKAANVATATLSANVPADTAINTSSGHTDTTSWSTFGYKTDGQFIQFTLDTTNYTGVQMSFWVANPSPANGPTQFTVTVNAGAGFGAPVLTVNSPAAAFTQHTIDLTGLTNTSGNTLIRITATGANNNASGASLLYDDMVYTGCTTAIQPTIAKAFSPSPIAVNGISTLTFTLTNTNTAALNNATFSDSLPAGVQVAATPAAATTCGGTWTPAAGNTTLNFSGGTIPASGSCTISVNVTATTAGPHTNISGVLSTTESGTNTSSVATATLTATLPPSIEKEFAPTPILAGATSTLTFTLTNPNQNDALAGVAFSDTFPTSPGSMVVAPAPNATTSGCGAPTFAPAPGSGSIAFSGGSLAAGGSCTVTVDVTAPAVGTYNNTSGNVSALINAQTVNGNTASASLTVDPPHPSIALLKQVGPSNSGPWTPFLAVSPPAGVYYLFTIENTGDVPLLSPSITDNTLDVSTCNATFSGTTLPVAVAANNNHIVTCVIGPIATTSGDHVNTASASATFSGNPVNSSNSSAIYASTGLTLAKSVTESSFTLPGDTLHYSYLVTNNGFAPLAGPVTVSDNKATVTCPAVTTVGDLDNFLDPGESLTCTATYIVTPTDVANAQVTNVAMASADSVSSNQDSRTVPLSTSADVSIDKTLVTAGPYFAGQSISYTLTVANAGPSTATAIQVTDSPTNLTITNVSGSGCSSLPCTIASLASGANTTINVTATITAAGAFDNSATATAAQPDPDPTNNTDSTNNGGTATLSADVSIDKTLITAGPYSAGQSISYTLVVANGGPSTATSIVVTDTPTNLTITNVTGSGCPALPCTIPSLASGANTTINVTATINAAGAFDNTASANGAEPDPDTTNNTDNTGNGGTAGASADVSIVKTLVTAGPYTVGQSLAYTLVVANAGPSTATSIVVTDTPTNLTITNVSGSGCSALPCTIPTLASGANTTINVTAKITAAGAFDNVATANGVEPDPNTGNNTDNTGNGGTTTAPQLTVTKTATPNPFTVGMPASYTVTVTNSGSVTTSGNIIISDTLPSGITLTTASGTNWSCGGTTALTCTFTGTLAAGASTVLTLNVAVAATATTGDNTATASGGGDSSCPAAAHCVGTVPVSVVAPQLTLTKTATPSSFAAGQPASYTITVSNTGTGATTVPITVADTLPAGITLASTSGANWACTGSSALTCTFSGTLNPAGSTSLTLNVNVSVAATSGTNTATASGGGDPSCPAASRCSSTVPVSVNSPQLDLAKSATPNPFVVGQAASYLLTITNSGSVATSGNITINDTLPAGITLKSSTGTNWSCSGTTVLVCTYTGTLAPASATQLTLNVNVGATATTGNNTATVGGGSDTTCPSASHCASTVQVPIAPSVAPIITPTPVNARWTLGLLLLTLLISGAAKFDARRRSAARVRKDG